MSLQGTALRQSVSSTATILQKSDGMPFRDLFQPGELETFVQECAPQRNRIFSPDVTLLAFLSQATSNEKSCKSGVMSVLSHNKTHRLQKCSLKTSSYVRARQKIPEASVVGLAKNIAKKTEEETSQKWLWKNRKVRFIDGSTVTLADSVENQASFPQHKNQKKNLGFPLARISAMTSLETASVVDFEMSSWVGKGRGELFLGRKMLESLEGNEVLVGDSFYLSYFFINNVMRKNADFLTRKKNKCFVVYASKNLGKNDRLILVKKPRIPHTGWVSQEDYENSPGELVLRETTIISKKAGFRDKTITLISTLTDKKKYPADKLAELYAFRWNIELDFRTIKKSIGLDFLKCKTPAMALKEAWVYILAYNLIRRMIQSAALSSGQAPREISFNQSLMLYRNFSRSCILHTQRLSLIAQCKIHRRPGRFEPRAIKRRINYNDFPRLRLSRSLWRLMTILPELDLVFSQPMEKAILNIEKLMPSSNYGKYNSALH